MDVNLEDLVVIADDERIADAGEISAQRVEVDVGAALANDVDGVKGEGDGFHQDIAGAGEDVGFGIIALALFTGNHLAAQGGENRFEDDHVALAAGVDDARFLQDGVLVDGVLEGEIAGLDAGDKRVFQGRALVRRLGSGLGREAGNGENGSLGGLHDGLVSGGNTVGHGAGELHGPCGVKALEPLGDPAEQQGQNHAGVAARTAQHGAGHTVGRGGNTVKVFLAQFRRGVVDGEAHVGAGVAVRYREHVQVVDGLDIFMQCRIRAENHLFKSCGINIVFQDIPPGEG